MIRARRYKRRQAAYVDAVRELLRVEPTDVDECLKKEGGLAKRLEDEVTDIVTRHGEFSIGL